MRKKLLIWIGAIVAVFAVVYGVLWHNSFDLALYSADFSPDKIVVIERGEGGAGEYCVVVEQTEDGKYKPLYLEEGTLGWWTADGLARSFEDDSGSMTALWWSIPAGQRWHDIEETEFLWENHAVYCGSDAQLQIQIPLERLPDGTTVNITQAGQNYVMHFISYGGHIPEPKEAHGMIAEFCAPQ